MNLLIQSASTTTAMYAWPEYSHGWGGNSPPVANAPSFVVSGRDGGSHTVLANPHDGALAHQTQRFRAYVSVPPREHLPDQEHHHPLSAGPFLSTAMMWAFWRKYRGSGIPPRSPGEKKETPGTPPSPPPAKYPQHKATMQELQTKFRAATDNISRVDIARKIAETVTTQTEIYTADLQGLSDKDKLPILRAFEEDVQVLTTLLYHWPIRQDEAVDTAYVLMRDTYFKLTNVWLRAIPTYFIYQFNTTLTFLFSLIFRTLLDAMGPELHGLFPDVFTNATPTYEYWNWARAQEKLNQFLLFGSYYVTLYSGTEGLLSKSENYRISRAWNRFMRGVGSPLSWVTHPPLRMADRTLHWLFGKPWEVISTLLYVSTRWGVPGLNKYIAHCLPGRKGEIVGTLYEIMMGSVGNVANSVIFKMDPGLTMMEKFVRALGNPIELLRREVFPSLGLNSLMSYANTRVSQYRRNDLVSATVHRTVMGVNKGGMYNAINSSRAIGSDAFAWAGQFFIAVACITYSLVTTNDRVRDAWDRFSFRSSWSRLRQRPTET